MTTKLIIKYLLSAGAITLVSEVVRRNDRLGALLASLPFVSVITLFWIYYESAPQSRLQKTGDHMFYIFWYVLPTLPMFILFPWLQRHFGFYGALTASAFVTIALFAALRFGAGKCGLML
jgi:hypothetical protein